jgi:acyl-coenzyme A thioesterase PaaI-like protein
MEGRGAWLEGNHYGDFGVLKIEVTPVLGTSNPMSPGLNIWFDNNAAHAAVTFGWMYEGADNIAHGGWVAAVCDEFLGNAQVLSGKIGMTGSLTVRYFKPTPLNQELLLQAKILSVEERKITVGGEMWAADTLIAGVFVHRMPVDIPIRFELGNIR